MTEGDHGPWDLPQGLADTVLRSNLPSEEEAEKAVGTAAGLLQRCRDVLKELGHADVEALLAGSVAKGTMAKGPDLDIFLIFPEGTDEAVMERAGLEVGSRVLEGPEKKYTQHPYMSGQFNGMAADIVPCLRMKRGERIRTAVDRTPFHTEYVLSHLDGQGKRDVVLLKSFLKGIGVYGAEDTVNGFSGYLAELMVIRFGSFRSTISFLSSLMFDGSPPHGCEEVGIARKPLKDIPMVLFEGPTLMRERPRSEKYYKETFKEDALVVIDPVDPERNVASPISLQTLSYTAGMSRALIRAPITGMFSPFSKRPFPIGSVTEGPEVLTGGKGAFFSIDLPPGNPGIVITQLRSSLNKTLSHLKREGFRKASVRYLVIFPAGWNIDQSYRRSRFVWSAEGRTAPVSIICLTTDPAELDLEYVHWGPPVDNARSMDFRDRWGERVKTDKTSGRLYVTLRRKETSPGPMMKDHWDSSLKGSSFRDLSLRPLEKELIEKWIRVVLQGPFDPFSEHLDR